MLATRRRDIAAIAYGFMASKALFAALEIGLFSLLADGPRYSTHVLRPRESRRVRLLLEVQEQRLDPVAASRRLRKRVEAELDDADHPWERACWRAALSLLGPAPKGR